MKLLFTRRPVVGSALIRAATWSGWSHLQVFEDEETLIGASWPHGVIRESLSDRLALASKAAMMTIRVPNEAESTKFLIDQIGKPYDTLGMLGLGLHRDWQDDDAWWCSELAAAVIQAGGKKLFRDGALRRVTPQHLWILNYPVQILK